MAECQSLGDVKGRYLAVANGEVSTASQDGEVDDESNVLVDKNGEKIQKSGVKERVVSSADGVKNIKAMFGNKPSTWQKPTNNDEQPDTAAVDAASVNSARNLFKNFDQQKNEGQQKSFNRPTTKKRDAKELMEMRKKATYGDDDADIQDGVVKKSVVVDESEIAASNQKEALNKYKQLENSNKNTINAPENRPTNRLLSDNDVKDEFSRRSNSISSSVASSEQGDVGYEGSVSPCSPTSEMSDDYISDDTPKDGKGICDVISLLLFQLITNSLPIILGDSPLLLIL